MVQSRLDQHGRQGSALAWLFAMTVALIGLLAMEAGGIVALPADTFSRTAIANFVWVRYVLGGLLVSA